MTDLLKFWTEKIIEIDPAERERPRIGLILEKIPEVVSGPRSNKKVELKMGNGYCMLVTNLGAVWKFFVPTSPCKSDRRSHGASETVADEG